MATLLEFEQDGQKIYVDVTPPGRGVQAATGAEDATVKRAQASFEQALHMAGLVARSFRGVVDEFGVKGAELELGFQFTGKGTIYIVQSEAQAAIKIKLSFEPNRRAADGLPPA